MAVTSVTHIEIITRPLYQTYKVAESAARFNASQAVCAGYSGSERRHADAANLVSLKPLLVWCPGSAILV